MKKFISKIMVLLVILTVCDFLIGKAGSFLVEHAKGGDTQRRHFIANKTSEEILIFGSSRAIHHYDSNILEDSLGHSVYNCGFEGNGILCAYGFYRMIAHRYNPKVIIYDICPGFDLQSGDNHRYLGNLRFYYDKSGVSEIFSDVDQTERYKMHSKMYRYKSMILQLITDNIHPLHGDNKGYSPLDGEISKKTKPLVPASSYDYDSLKIEYIEKLMKDCEGKTKLIFTVSPYYLNTSSDVLIPLMELCRKYNVPLINNYANDSFNQVRDYFRDPAHLNRKGSTEYSKYVASKLKGYL